VGYNDSQFSHQPATRIAIHTNFSDVGQDQVRKRSTAAATAFNSQCLRAGGKTKRALNPMKKSSTDQHKSV
jgi:hypothetical protein